MRRLLLTCLVLAVPALGQTTPKAVPQPKKTVVIFGDGEEIDGKTEFPEGKIIEVKQRVIFNSMIKVRDSFSDKLLESVHEL